MAQSTSQNTKVGWTVCPRRGSRTFWSRSYIRVLLLVGLHSSVFVIARIFNFQWNPHPMTLLSCVVWSQDPLVDWDTVIVVLRPPYVGAPIEVRVKTKVNDWTDQTKRETNLYGPNSTQKLTRPSSIKLLAKPKAELVAATYICSLFNLIRLILVPDTSSREFKPNGNYRITAIGC